jgi:hypothetical protein
MFGYMVAMLAHNRDQDGERPLSDLAAIEYLIYIHTKCLPPTLPLPRAVGQVLFTLSLPDVPVTIPLSVQQYLPLTPTYAQVVALAIGGIRQGRLNGPEHQQPHSSDHSSWRHGSAMTAFTDSSMVCKYGLPKDLIDCCIAVFLSVDQYTLHVAGAELTDIQLQVHRVERVVEAKRKQLSRWVEQLLALELELIELRNNSDSFERVKHRENTITHLKADMWNLEGLQVPQLVAALARLYEKIRKSERWFRIHRFPIPTMFPRRAIL